MECWLLVPETRPRRAVRGLCFTFFFIGVVFAESVVSDWPTDSLEEPWALAPLELDGAICIGSTSTTPWDCARQDFWQASYGDLTAEGKLLFKAVERLYHTRPRLVMVLAT
jgi:hypothetical protein